MKKYTFKNGKMIMEDYNHEPLFTINDLESDVEEEKDNTGSITEDLANSIDWVKLTKNFNPDRIKDIVETIGKNKRDKKIIIIAIFNAMLAREKKYKVNYGADRWLEDYFKEIDDNHKGLLDIAYDEETETLNLDVFMKHKIDEYMKRHTATDNDIDEIFDSPTDSAIVIGENSNQIDKSTLPEEFKTPEAEQLMQKLVKADLLTKNWLPFNLSIAERGYLADEISTRLNICYKWKVMGELWNENPGTLRTGKNNAMGQKKTGAFIEKLKNILG